MPAANTVTARLPACKSSTELDSVHAKIGRIVWEYCEQPAWCAEFDSRADAATWLATFRRCGEQVRTLSDGTVQIGILGRWETVVFDDA